MLGLVLLRVCGWNVICSGLFLSFGVVWVRLLVWV